MSEPGVDTDRWIGNACVTDSGRRAVVVYGPRSFGNRAELFQRGGFTAVVDLKTGDVTKLGVRSTLAYFNPGCGSGESAVISQARGGEVPGGPDVATRLFPVDAGAGTLGEPVELAGQVTSPVPTADGIVAAAGTDLVAVGPGGDLRTVTRASSVPFRVAVDSDGGVVFMEHADGKAQVRHVASTRGQPVSRLLGRGNLDEVNVTRGRGGRVWITGAAQVVPALPASVAKLDVGAGAEVSSHGRLAVLHDRRTPAPVGASAAAAPGKAWERALTVAAAAGGEGPGAVELQTVVVPTGRRLVFKTHPGADANLDGGRAHPLNAAAPRASYVGGGSRRPGAAASTGVFSASATDPVDGNATCSVPRNHVGTQVYQPTPRQVEWAADQAVINNLRMTRPFNWKGSGLAAWVPQELFPPRGLEGGGRINVQVLLGILSAESNLWQASGKALSGVIANPLVGNFYGRKVYDDDPSNDWDINFSDADCGYGVSQITDGMRKEGSERPGEVALTVQQQFAAGVDYATNIAAGMRILEDKWNQTRGGGVIHSNGDPKWLENWFFAIWAYNSGFYANKGDGSPWGVGWFNNPANPIYPANRAFFNKNPRDAAHPQDWPYPEKVIGWAAYSIATLDGPGFRAAWWVSEAARDAAKPPIYTFCTAANQCDPATASKCTRADSKCWWNQPVTFNNCAQGYCGNELHRFNSTYPEQPDGTNYPPTCSLDGLPPGALIVDNVPTSVASVRPCSKGWTNAGSFGLNFAADAAGRYPSKVDFHQIGSGFGGHFWFGYGRDPAMHGGKLRVTGKWTFNQSLSSWGRVLVHMPDHGAKTQQARYTIHLGNGSKKYRAALQRTRENRWISLGVVRFAGTPAIELSTDTVGGDGTHNVAWDAVAIQPLPNKPANVVVALGDGHASGEGASNPSDGDDYYQESDNNGDDPDARNACHRSPHAWSRQAVLPDQPSTTIGSRDDAWDPSMDYQLHACSGASTANLRINGRGQYGELSQIDKGYLDASTTLVTLNIGAVDARLPEILTTCAYYLACPDRTLAGESEAMKLSVPKKIDGPVRDAVLATLREIKSRAPNAKIALMGYPRLFNGGCVNGINTVEADWINTVTDRLTAMLNGVAGQASAEGIATTLSDPIATFAGKAICGSPETVHGVVSTKTEGDTPTGWPPSQQSFHPKISGAQLYANALGQTSSSASPAPTGLIATGVRSGQIALAWNASPGATHYTVKRSTTAGGPYATVADGVTVTEHVDTGLTNGTRYYYVVSPSGGPNSAEASAIPPAPAVTDVVAPARNLIGNGEFNSGTTGWGLTPSGTAAGTMSVVPAAMSGPNGLEVRLSNGGAGQSAMALRRGLSVVNGITYEVEFLAKASAAKQITVQLRNRSTTSTVYWSKTIDVTTAATLHRLRPFRSGVSDSSAELVFFIGGNTTTFYLDAVVVVPSAEFRSAPGNLLANADFNSGTTGWTLGLSGGAAATMRVVNPGRLVGDNALRVTPTNGGTGPSSIQVSQTVTVEAYKYYDFGFSALTDWARPDGTSVAITSPDGSVTRHTQQFIPTPTGSSFGLYQFYSGAATSLRIVFNIGGTTSPFNLDLPFITMVVPNSAPAGGLLEKITDGQGDRAMAACLGNAAIAFARFRGLEHASLDTAIDKSMAVCGLSYWAESSANATNSGGKLKLTCASAALAQMFNGPYRQPLKERAFRATGGCATGMFYGALVAPATADGWDGWWRGLGQNLVIQGSTNIAIEAMIRQMSGGCRGLKPTETMMLTGLGTGSTYISSTRVKGSDWDPDVVKPLAVGVDYIASFLIVRRSTGGPHGEGVGGSTGGPGGGDGGKCGPKDTTPPLDTNPSPQPFIAQVHEYVTGQNLTNQTITGKMKGII